MIRAVVKGIFHKEAGMTTALINNRQEYIRELIAGNAAELIEFSNGEVGTGWEGGDPGGYFTTVAVKGRNKFASWRNEDQDYHYLPSFGFAFELVSYIPFPKERSGADRIAFISKGMRSAPDDSSQIGLWVSLTHAYDFFDVLNGVRDGDHFAPFRMQGEEEIAQKLKAEHYLRISADVEGEKVQAIVPDVLDFEAEDAIEACMGIFALETQNFRELAPLYEGTDGEGTRLWTDQGLQSKAYYATRKKITRRLLGRFSRALKRRGAGCKTSWGIGGFLARVRYLNRECGPAITLLMLLVEAVAGTRNAFRNYETLRLERLRAYKERERSMGTGA